MTMPHPCSADLIPQRPSGRIDYPLDASGSSVNSYSDSYSNTPLESGSCYVDLVIALDLSCMNNDEYAQHTPQDFVTDIVDDLIRRSVFKPELEFRISLIGFTDRIEQHVTLSEFNFMNSRNGKYARERIMEGLEYLQERS